MSELDVLILDPRLKRALPVAFARIFVSRAILDELRITVALTKYRHHTTFVRPADKPISKPNVAR